MNKLLKITEWSGSKVIMIESKRCIYNYVTLDENEQKELLEYLLTKIR